MLSKFKMDEEKKLKLRDLFLEFFDSPKGYKVTAFRETMKLDDYTDSEIANMSLTLRNAGLLENISAMQTSGAVLRTTEDGRKVLSGVMS